MPGQVNRPTLVPTSPFGHVWFNCNQQQLNPAAPHIAAQDPWYAAGSWVPELIRLAGGQDVLGRVEEAVTFEPKQLQSKQPEVLIFALCGFTLEETVKQVQRSFQECKEVLYNLPAVKSHRLIAVDGVRVFSRPGPWLVESLEVLIEVLHSEAQPYGHEGKLWKTMSCT